MSDIIVHEGAEGTVPQNGITRISVTQTQYLVIEETPNEFVRNLVGLFEYFQDNKIKFHISKQDVYFENKFAAKFMVVESKRL